MKPLNILDAKPSQRTQKIIDGYDYVASRFIMLTTELEILNNWLRELPELLHNNQASLPEGAAWLNSIEGYNKAGDSLTAAIVTNAQYLSDFAKAVKELEE